MDTVKEERVSPLLGEGGGSYCPPEVVNPRPCVLQVVVPPPPPPPQQPPPPPPPSNSHKTTIKSYLSSPPSATVITTASSNNSSNSDLPLPRSTVAGRGGGGLATTTATTDEGVVVETVLLTNAQNFSGEISEAVSKILEDYDWSKIPLANKDGATDSERRKVHVKRPMNAFMVWAQEARRKLSCSHRQVHNAELSKSLGRIWRGMTEDQKRPFIERADHLRRKHKQEYPDYKYQPRRRKDNVKTVGKPSPGGGPLSVQEMSANHHFVSAVKGGALGLSLHPLSPPHSPSGHQVVRGVISGGGHHVEGHMGETVFVPDCLADSFETIDRAEMNKYLLPDQGAPGAHYVTAPGGHVPPHGGALQPMTTMSSMNSMTVPSSSSSSSSSGGGSSSSTCSGSGPTLPSLPPLASRLLPSAPVYGSSGSPYYHGGASPQHGSHGSPDLSGDIGVPPAGGVSPGGSPGSPPGEYVELQPPRVPKEEPLPPLTAPKPANVSPFLHQNLCYSTQPYAAAFQYSYPYAAMWH